MGRIYKKKEIIEEYVNFKKNPKEKENNLIQIYKKKFINWAGVTSDSGECYTEIIAERILEDLAWFNKETGIFITRCKNYFTESHNNCKENFQSYRKEENFAKKMYCNNKIEKLGVILDYQIPLKNSNKNIGLGKIDLISCSEEDKRLFLIELKCKSSKETLLKAMMEIYSYCCTIDKKKLLEDAKGKSDKCKDITEKNIIPVVIINAPCDCYVDINQEIKLNDVDLAKQHFLQKLSEELKILLFQIIN